MRYVINIKELGEDVSWLLVNQAMGIPDAKMQSDFMVDKVVLLLFTAQSLPERLCVTAAVRQMSGTTIYQGDSGGQWRQEINRFQEDMLPIFASYMDCMYTYGFPVGEWDMEKTNLRFPLINAGSPDAHPAHALADLACMLKISKSFDGVHTAWIGCDNGTLHSLIEAMAWFNFSLSIALPPGFDATIIKERAEKLKADVTFANSPEEAVADASFIYAGKFCNENGQNRQYVIDEQLMAKARKGAKLLLCASPMRAIPIAPNLLRSPSSMLTRQAEYRLRIHKRILHWVFDA